MRADEPDRTTLRALLTMGGAFPVAALSWIVARSLDAHAAAGTVLCVGGALSALLNARATFAAWAIFDETTNGDPPGVRGRARLVLALCPLVLFTSVFVFESGRLALTVHHRRHQGDRADVPRPRP